MTLGGQEVLDISAAAAAGFVIAASAMLLLLFYFINQAFVYVLVAMFTIASSQALAVVLLAVAERALPAAARRSEVVLPLFGSTPVLTAGSLAAAAAVGLTWAVLRNAPWSWVLQDGLGIALMLVVLRTLRIPSIRVACVLLPLCFAYDVFWVFIQPLFFGGGKSVMVQVSCAVWRWQPAIG